MDSLHSRIQKLAYDNFIARGMTHGKDVEDWLKAEEEILMKSKEVKKPIKSKSSKRKSMI